MWHLIDTDGSWRSFTQRVILALLFLPHVMQQLFGAFGGPGFAAAAQGMAQTTHLPYAFGAIAVLAQAIGMLLLFTGFLTRLGALGISTVMAFAIAFVHVDHGFFMNWYGRQAGEGFEYHLLVLAIAVPLIITGGGRWSIDRAIAREHAHHAV